MNAAEPIAIVGMQCLYPGAANLEAYWRNITSGVDAIRDVPTARWNPSDYDLLRGRRGGFLEGLTEFDPLDHGIMPSAVQHGDPEQFLVFGVVHGALRDAARGRRFRETGVCSPDPVEISHTPRTEVVIGRGGYNGNTIESAYLRMEFVAQVGELLARILPDTSPQKMKEIRELLATAFPHRGTTEMLASSIPNLTSGRVANRLDFQGGNYTVDAACASGLIATDLVLRALRERRCDVGIAAAVHLVQKPYFWFAFELLQALSPTGACRAFSRSADGLVIGEGLGAIVLKRLDDAERDGDRVYAVLRGIGTASDGKAMGILTPRKEGQVLSLRRAYEESGVDPASIQLIEGHGTAMRVGDDTEIATLHEVFGKEGPPSIALGSVKSMIGHLMPAAGMAGLIKTALALHHRVYPPTIHVEEPHPLLKEGRFYVNTKLRPWIGEEGLVRRAGVNAFGFGGINTHAVLEEAPATAPRESLTPRSCELFALSAPNRGALREKLARWQDSLDRLAGSELRDLAYTASLELREEEPARLTIVARTVADLGKKLAHASDRLTRDSAPSWHDESGLAFAEAPYPGKLAFLFPGLAFPGLGAGYTDRLGELCIHFPEAREEIDFAESVSHTVDTKLEYPLSHQFYPPPLSDAKTLAKLERELIWSDRTPLGQMCSGLASWRIMTALGVRPDAMAGFSMGEWGALVAAGVLHHNDLRQMLSLWQSMGDVPEQLTGLWGMVGTSADKVEAVLQRLPGIASIIMDPSPTQTFFAGEADTVRAALAILRAEGVFVQEIPFPAIHTPLASQIVEGLRAVKSAMPARRPRARVYCGMNGQPYPDDPEQIRDWLISSFAEPLRGKETVRNLYHGDGVRIFVELGIGGRSAQSLARILEGAPHVSLAVDLRGLSGLEQLHQLLGRLIVLGVPFDLGYLFRNRACRAVDFAQSAAPMSRLPMHLDLAHPRARVPEESVARLRDLLAPAAPAPLPTTAPAGPLGDVMATMQRFLEVQQLHEAAETQLLASFLATQQSAMAQFLAATERPPATKPPARFAFPTEVVSHVPGKELETRLILDVDEHPFLADHAFIKVPESIKPTEERLPTLPMTFGIEILAETAAQLVPELQVIGCQDVEASRWIALLSQKRLALTLRARRVEPTVVEVDVRAEDQKSPALRGRVLFGGSLPAPPAPREVSYDRPCEHRAEELYTIPYLFHGPRFQVISRLIGTSDTTLVAELTLRDPQELFSRRLEHPPILDPVLLDGVGQVVGYKLLLDDWVVYPLRLGRLTAYRRTPPPGAVVRLLACYKRLDGRRVEMDADIVDPEGQLWLRIESWQVWRILWPRELNLFSRQPRQRRVGIRWPTRDERAHCSRMMARLFGEISPEWIARYCLPAREWQTYRERPRFDWLLGRIALKDAIRDWFREHRGQVLLHLEIEIADGEDGQPILVSPAEPGLKASVAWVEDEALAVAFQGRGAGVDLALLGKSAPGSFDAREESVLATGGNPEEWRQRAGCARRALARALGKPANGFRVTGLVRDGRIDLEGEGVCQAVETSLDGDRILAVVTIP